MHGSIKRVPAAWALCAAAAATGAAQAQSQSGIDISGQLDFGARVYFDDGLYAGQAGAGAEFFIGATFNASMAAGPGFLNFQVDALADSNNGRTVLNVRRAYYAQAFDSWDILVGYNVENWGVAESRSVLNVINPRDETDVIYGGDLIGTPMINANFQTDFGTFSAYALLGFVPPNNADAGSRQRGFWPTADDRAVFEEGNGRNLDVALRWTNNYSLGAGALDVSASYFNGTSRTPVGLPGCGTPAGAVTDAMCDAINAAIVGAYESGIPAAGDPQDLYDLLDSFPEPVVDAAIAALSGVPVAGIVPYYQHIHRGGVSAVYATGDLQLRFEGAFTKPRSEDGYWSAVVGGDYTFYGIGPTDGTLTVVAEYLYDDRQTRNPLTLFENDLFLGANFLLNDTRDTRLRAGGFYDLDSHAQLYQISASTRLNDSVRLEMNAMHVQSNGWNDPLSFIDNDNFVEFKLSTFF